MGLTREPKEDTDEKNMNLFLWKKRNLRVLTKSKREKKPEDKKPEIK